MSRIEDKIINQFNPSKEQEERYFEVADSLWKQQHVFKEGEFDPGLPNVKMFNTDTGKLSDEYIKAARIDPNTLVQTGNQRQN